MDRLETIEGTWRPIRAEHEGQLAPEMVLGRMKMVFTRDRYRLHFGDEVSDEGSYALQVEDGQFLLHLHGKTGLNAGRVIPAIVQLRANLLRICYGMDGVRPDGFVAGAFSARYLVTYRRHSTPRS
jgi:uncharacterized protein (TIGR03067 family)